MRQHLGADLAMVYAGAIESSVSTGSYDVEWTEATRPRIERYLQILHADWTRKQTDLAPVTARVAHILEHGTEAEKTQLKKLLHLEQ